MNGIDFIIAAWALHFSSLSYDLIESSLVFHNHSPAVFDHISDSITLWQNQIWEWQNKRVKKKKLGKDKILFLCQNTGLSNELMGDQERKEYSHNT